MCRRVQRRRHTLKYPVLVILGIHLSLISLIAIAFTVADKIKAKRGKWRVPESSLLIIAAFGGSLIMYITMRLIRHKTRHPKFMRGLPIMILFHCIVLLWTAHVCGLF